MGRFRRPPLEAFEVDVDGLLRLGDLDPRYLRNAEAKTMVGFAQALFDATDGGVPTGDDHFAALWTEAIRILSAIQ